MLPANSVVTVTVYNYDGQSGLRNPFISQAEGIKGGTFTLDGKPTKTVDPDAASHIFAIPQLGVSVPIYGVPDDAKNQCANAPCGLASAHSTTTFTFHTGQAGAVSLAVLRPVRGRLHRRVGRADADRRLHGRLHQGRMRGT